MNRTLLYIIPTFAVLLFAACASDNHSHDEKKEKEEKHEAKDEHADHAGEIIMTKHQIEEAHIHTVVVQPSDFVDVIKVGGQIVSSQNDEHTVVATSDGIVQFSNLKLTEGASIVIGQKIATLSSSNLKDGDPVAKAKSAFLAAQSQLQRAKELVANKIISQKAYEQAKLEYDQTLAAYRGLEATASTGGIVIASPRAGYVKNILVRQGDYVTVGTPILTITSNRRLQLRAEVPQQYLRYLPSVSGANFRIPGDDTLYRLSAMNGRVESYARSLQDNSAFAPVTLSMDNVGNLLPGSYAEVYLLMQSGKPCLSLPLGAITEEQGVHFVYVAEPDEPGVFIKREVTIGKENGDRVEILSGIKAGETVVTQGAMQVRLASMSGSVPEGHTHSH